MMSNLLFTKKRRVVAGTLGVVLVLVITSALYAQNVIYLPVISNNGAEDTAPSQQQPEPTVSVYLPMIINKEKDEQVSEIMVENLGNGWQHVTNTVYRYSIDIPNDWKVDENPDYSDLLLLFLNIDPQEVVAAGVSPENSHVGVGLVMVRSGETLDKYAGEFPGEIFKPSTPVTYFTVNGVRGVTYQYEAAVMSQDGTGLSETRIVYMFEAEQGVIHLQFEYEPYQIQLLHAKTGQVYTASVSQDIFTRVAHSFTLQ